MNREQQLKIALDLALNILIGYEPGDSRLVSNEFVAMAAVACGLDDLEESLEIIKEGLKHDPVYHDCSNQLVVTYL